jgi:hypothetical protein
VAIDQPLEMGLKDLPDLRERVGNCGQGILTGRDRQRIHQFGERDARIQDPKVRHAGEPATRNRVAKQWLPSLASLARVKRALFVFAKCAAFRIVADQ